MFTTRRPASHIDIANYNVLLYHDYDSSLDFTNNYLLSPSPRPMSYRDLRSVMSNVNPSNFVVLTEPSNSPSDALIRSHSSERNYRKQSSRKKKHKNPSIDVYRTLARAESRISTLTDRNSSNNELILLANSFVIDHTSASPTSGFFHPQNLPNIQKHRPNHRSKSRQSPSPTCRFQQNRSRKPTPVDIHYDENTKNKINRIGTSRTKLTSSSSSSNFSTRIQQIIRAKPTPPEPVHRTTPVDFQYLEDSNEIPIPTVNYSPLSEPQIRKQLHVYMPQIVSC